MNINLSRQKIRKYFKFIRDVTAVYVFGSHADGKANRKFFKKTAMNDTLKF